MQRSKSTTSALVFSVRDDRSGCRYTGRLLCVLRPTVYRNPPKTTIETHQRRCLLRVLSASDGVSSVVSRRLKPITADDRSGCLSSQHLLRLLSSSPQEERSNPTTEDDSVGKSQRKRRSSLVFSVRRAIETHPPPTTPLSILIFGNVDNCGRQGTSFCIGSVSTIYNGDNLIFVVAMEFNGDDESSFEQCYRCYPVTFIEKAHLDKGDKIIMPPSALNRLVEEEEPASKVPKFTPFTGSGKRLDGKTQTESTEQEDKPTVKGKDDELSTPTPPQKSGKLVFGSNSKQASKPTVKVDPKNVEQESSTKSDEAKFKVFTGKKYSLKD
ncbi:hypothetical protein F2Q68_00027653 [Brassica cretica]|uniref:Ubiquitin fusion degradation protein UFD1 N-terminal subdomain 1 domain-containing protein n=1 Tax=Brassica cretica TaxID=69181 RepID=A0A8S9IIP4_BRACR|nr:hypothetical protein F2Q68_00027653 [Brassica cretica]